MRGKPYTHKHGFEIMRQILFLFSPAFCLLFASMAAAQTQGNLINETEKKQVIDAVGKRLVDFYLYPDVAGKMAALLSKNLDNGVYKTIDDPKIFANRLTGELFAVSRDKHLEVLFGPESVSETKKEASRKETVETINSELERGRKNNFGFKEVKLLEGNIGYLHLTRFYDVKYGGETAANAMNFLSNADALIIDLRQNGGGDSSMVQLLTSYLFDSKPVHLNDFYLRDGEKQTQIQEWTLPYVPGRRRPDSDVYILTAYRTFSAGEHFVYNLKTFQRATIVGETTGGGAHTVAYQIINDRFLLKVPNGRPINQVTKSNWEGTGIKPDIETPPGDALLAAQIKALEKLTARTDSPDAKFTYDWHVTALRAKLNPVRIDESLMRSYAGTYTGEYGQRKITFENGRLFSQRAGGAKLALIPLAAELFTYEARPELRLKIVVENNRVTGLKSIANDGSQLDETRDKDEAREKT